jgi:hypothetical protein
MRENGRGRPPIQSGPFGYERNIEPEPVERTMLTGVLRVATGAVDRQGERYRLWAVVLRRLCVVLDIWFGLPNTPVVHVSALLFRPSPP